MAKREAQCKTCFRTYTYDTSDPNKQTGHAPSCVYWLRRPKSERPSR